MLADDAGGRELPVWLTKFDGERLVQLAGHGRAEASTPLVSTAEELTVRLLRTIRAAVTAVDIDELGPGLRR